MKTKKVCGDLDSYCQPTNSTRYDRVTDAMDYTTADRILGRVYAKRRSDGSRSTVFEHSKCTNPGWSAPTADNWDSLGKQSMDYHLAADTKKEVKAKLTADLVQLFKKTTENEAEAIGDDKSDKARAAIVAGIDASSFEKSTLDLKLRYERGQLKTNFIDEDIEACLETLTDGEKIVVGASTIRVSGESATDTLTKFLAEFEASGGYKTLSAEAIAIYEKSKKTALDTLIEPVSIVFAVGYRSR